MIDLYSKGDCRLFVSTKDDDWLYVGEFGWGIRQGQPRGEWLAFHNSLATLHISCYISRVDIIYNNVIGKDTTIELIAAKYGNPSQRSGTVVLRMSRCSIDEVSSCSYFDEDDMNDLLQVDFIIKGELSFPMERI